jgi:muramoyltetrapeptide carboxypeptidase
MTIKKENLKCDLVELSYPSPKKEIKKAQRNLIILGFKEICTYNHSKKYFGKWAGDPEERLEKLYSAWNSSSPLVITLKGGSGISHFFQKIKKSKLKKRKLFCGYSDVTLMLLYLVHNLKFISLHGPNASKRLDKESIKFLKKALKMENYPLSFKKRNIINKSKKIIKGETTGGNLSRLVEFLVHNKINFSEKIVFLEDVNESHFKIFNKIMHLKNYRKFKPKAIIFGNMGIKENESLRKMIKNEFPKTPIIYGLPFGHQEPNITIPLGIQAEIDFSKKMIYFKFAKKYKKYSIDLDYQKT